MLFSIPSYKWVINDFLIGRLDVIRKNRSITFDKKNEIKLGFTYNYLNFIKTNTPENAIILMPPDSVINRCMKKGYFVKYVIQKPWASYFVYPRKLIYQREFKKNELRDIVTHVAVVDYWGYDLLNYPINKKGQFGIFPINHK
ncbi:MAG: hypothetical protein KAT48_14435 [Bacteroidales bacterium]|nr:hypothetical protein [Bacteroidales bacterium]